MPLPHTGVTIQHAQQVQARFRTKTRTAAQVLSWIAPPAAPSTGLPVAQPQTAPQAQSSTHYSTIMVAASSSTAHVRPAAPSLVSPQVFHPANRARPTRYTPQPLYREVANGGAMSSQGHSRRAPRVPSNGPQGEAAHYIRAASYPAFSADPYTASTSPQSARQSIPAASPPTRALNFGISAAVLASSGLPVLGASLADSAAVSSWQTGTFLSAKLAQDFLATSMQPVQPAEPEARVMNFDRENTSSSGAAEPAQPEARVANLDPGNIFASEAAEPKAGASDFFTRGSSVAGAGLEADAAWSIAAEYGCKGFKPNADKVSRCAQGSTACCLSQLGTCQNRHEKKLNMY